MKPFLLLCLLLGLTTLAQSQELSTVTGRVLSGAKPLSGASVAVSRLADSSTLLSVITTSDGRFTLPSLPMKDSLKINISFIGHAPYAGLLILKDKRFAMAPVSLQELANQMEAIVIKTEKLVEVRGDTIEFSASAIKTPPNSVAADLVNRIPGLDLDRNGKLTYNGRPIARILVDGKTFFGADGAVALANLPANMIDKIQLANDSIQEGIGQTDIDPQQTLNFKLKPGKKYIAKGYVAAGTDERYDGSVFGSRIMDDDRLSLRFGRNNVNKAGMNMDNNIQVFTNGSGVTRTSFGGLDYAHGKKGGSSINANYNFDLPLTYRETLRERVQNVLPSSTLISNNQQSARNQSSSHAGQVQFKNKGTATSLSMSARGSYSHFNNLTNNASTTTDGSGATLNALQSSYSSKGSAANASFTMDGDKRFTKRGRHLSWDLNLGYGGRNAADHNDALTQFYKNNLVDSQYHFLQEIENTSRSTNLGAHLRYSEPIGKHSSIGISESVNARWGQSDRTTWALDSTGKRTIIDSLYSNRFQNRNLTTNTTLNYHFRSAAWMLRAGIGILQNHNRQEDLFKHKIIEQNGINPSSNINLTHSAKKASWTLSSSADYQLPSLEQLQPVQDLTNPLYIVIGNPDLRPEVSYASQFSWSNKKPQINGRPLAVLNRVQLGYNAVHDQIVRSVVYDTLGKQTVSYQNVNGIYQLNGSLNFALQHKWAANLMTFSFTPKAAYNSDKTFLNGTLYNNSKLAFTPSLNVKYKRSDAVAMELAYNPAINSLHYGQNRALDQHYTLHSLNFDLDLYLFKLIKMSHSIDYTYNKSLPASFARSSLLWNASASVLCLKNKRGEISLSAFDILKQFNNLVRTVNSNYIEDTRSNNLQRYTLLGFKYFFGKIERKNEDGD